MRKKLKDFKKLVIQICVRTQEHRLKIVKETIAS